MKIKLLAVLAFLLFAVPVSSAQLTLTWEDQSNNEDGFKIYRRLAPSGSVFANIDSVLTDITEYKDSTVVVDVIYCYHVTSFNSSGESKPSNEDCAKAKEPEPIVEPVALGFKLDLNCTMKRLADNSLEITCPAESVQ